MVFFENNIYKTIKKTCRVDCIEKTLRLNKDRINEYAYARNIDVDTIKKQIRLHIPQFNSRLYAEKNFLDDYIFPILDIVFKDYKKQYEWYLRNCGAKAIVNMKTVVRWGDRNNGVLEILDDESQKFIVNAKIKIVDENIGNYIEKNLHYLRGTRKESFYRLGVFIENFKWPICYMNFCMVDRSDKIKSVEMFLGKETDSKCIIELSRVYGCGNLPRNMISLLIGYSAKLLRKQYIKYIITAVNLSLGFNGNSMIYSGMIPFATRKVKYNYNYSGEYCTKRRDEEIIRNNILLMPPNMLYIKPIQSIEIRYIQNLNYIDNMNLFNTSFDYAKNYLNLIRYELESLWDLKTVYHRTIIEEGNSISKGQCGVTSLWLSRVLANKGYKTMFCEGDLVFANEKYSIYNHCWVEILNDFNYDLKIIIDLTADQNGYPDKIIFNTFKTLKSNNIIYILKSKSYPYNIKIEHLLNRTEYLDKKIINSDLGGII